MQHPELVPLEGGEFRPLQMRRRRAQEVRRLRQAERSCVKGPLRVVRLLTFIIITPALFVLVPMYLRYRVFSGQMYPVGMTDMRLIDNKISTVWCQRQVVRSNATFNAFLMSEQPHISADLVPVSMTRYLSLRDDMKEYWGFYLLEGSVVTVSTCVRWPGASLTMIKGHKHLQQCAFIGDDSSEELEELLEANQQGVLSNATLLERIRILLKDDSPANDPDAMKRHKGGVRFHDPAQQTFEPNSLVRHNPPPMETSDVTDHDPQELRQMLERLHSQRRAGSTYEEKADKVNQQYRPPSHLMSLPALHRHRDTNVDRDERRWLSFNDLDDNTKFQETSQTVKSPTEDKNNDTQVKRQAHNSIADHKTEVKRKSEADNETKPGDVNTIDEDKSPTSAEVYEDIIDQLRSMSEKGRRVLDRLADNSSLKLATTTSQSALKELDDEKAKLRLKTLEKVLTEALGDESGRVDVKKMRLIAGEQARVRRELYIEQAQLSDTLNRDDEERNSALEEVLEADGFADVHFVVNETTANDMSNSEFWSSFSSSEEALLECEGLILNLPLTPHPSCARNSSDEQHSRAAQHNAVTYRVPANGYYFFVFNSENEVQENFIRVRFDLQKTTYDVRRTLLECRNYTDKCDIPLHFLSAEKVVLEVPLRDNDSLWNEEFVVISECIPRTSMYAACAIAVPLLVIVFAFQ